MNKTHIIEIPIYREELHLFFGSSEDCVKAMKKDKLSDVAINDWRTNNINCDASFTENEEGYLLLWLANVPATIRDYSNLVHEIEHVTFSILDYHGLKHTVDSDEAFAYLSGWLYEQIEIFIQNGKEKDTIKG